MPKALENRKKEIDCKVDEERGIQWVSVSLVLSNIGTRFGKKLPGYRLLPSEMIITEVGVQNFKGGKGGVNVVSEIWKKNFRLFRIFFGSEICLRILFKAV